MAYMGTVRALDHFYVLAPLYAECVKLPEGWDVDSNLPKSLIIVTSFRDFAPVLANYVDYMCRLENYGNHSNYFGLQAGQFIPAPRSQ
jgi:hypothetical protein